MNERAQLVGLTQGGLTELNAFNYGVDISEITWFLKNNNLLSDSNPQSKRIKSDSPSESNQKKVVTSLADLSFSQSEK